MGSCCASVLLPLLSFPWPDETDVVGDLWKVSAHSRREDVTLVRQEYSGENWLEKWDCVFFFFYNLDWFFIPVKKNWKSWRLRSSSQIESGLQKSQLWAKSNSGGGGWAEQSKMVGNALEEDRWCWLFHPISCWWLEVFWQRNNSWQFVGFTEFSIQILSNEFHHCTLHLMFSPFINQNDTWQAVETGTRERFHSPPSCPGPSCRGSARP